MKTYVVGRFWWVPTAYVFVEKYQYFSVEKKKKKKKKKKVLYQAILSISFTSIDHKSKMTQTVIFLQPAY